MRNATYTATFVGTAPLVISNVRSQGITSSAATVSWTTDKVATSQVEYGTTTAFGSITPPDSTLVTSHSVRITGLQADTQYQYRVLSRDASGNVTSSAIFNVRTKT